jgi:hypothetical protein
MIFMNTFYMGVVFVLLGAWCFLAPQSVLAFKVKWAKLFGATLKGSKKTLTAYKYFGAVLAAVGLYFLLTG